MKPLPARPHPLTLPGPFGKVLDSVRFPFLALLLAVLSGFAGGCRTAAPGQPIPPTVAAEYHGRVDRVLDRLLPVIPQHPCRRWGLVPSSVPNASMDADGTLRVTAGLLEFCDHDDLLAFAMAHELAHAALGHPRRLRRTGWFQAIVTGAALWAAYEWSDSKGDAALAGAGVFVSTAMLATLPSLRRMESQADLAARDILRRAGYPPDAAAAFWRRYARARPSPPRPLWFSAHPTDQDRIRRLSQP